MEMDIAYGTRNVGDEIVGVGIINQVSLTAYRVGSHWVSFSKVDRMQPVEPLIQIG